ncbi:pantoate--beta-alanine ligase [Ignatzschineria cameli]|uniref:pantoate--beta-alanine ligase n=1 Tax=Ignatzschineria cameli TaxID=2182793 RepID=UPI000D60DA64|nr:pantoate--beta-alanine ligase [Ignatzschineria cameli]PWD85906.1 pantoate--beta-alanine ligase [Ignatzschineria cameli]
MKILKSVAEVRQWRKEHDEVAFVPTMGNLHAGHLSLVAEAKRHSENVIVSIFVNPLQFGEGEDLDSYPRTLEADREKLEAAGVSALFLPTEEMLYGEDAPFLVVPPKSLIGELCGRDRPGHFEGVATVVTKFFNIVAPTYACFGKKDYQQLKVIEALVAALNFDIKIIPVAIEREESGLALSSRNGYLSDDERAQAVKISEVLKVLRENLLALDPSTRPENYHAYENEARTLLEREGFVVDYLSIREQKSLQLAKQADQHLVVLVAAKCGKTRLLDNIEINY